MPDDSIWTGYLSLRARQIAQIEIPSLLEIVTKGAVKVKYSIHLAEYATEGESLSGLRNEINNVAGLRTIRLDVAYAHPDQPELSLLLSGDTPNVSWRGATGADRAHRLGSRWNSLPGRARLSLAWVTRVGLGVAGALALLTSACIVTKFTGVQRGADWLDGLMDSWIQLAFLAIIFGATVLCSSEASPFRAVRAKRRPFVCERQDNLWRDRKFVISTAITLLSLIVAMIALATRQYG